MFHRVKSETPQDSSKAQDTKQEVSKDSSASDAKESSIKPTDKADQAKAVKSQSGYVGSYNSGSFQKQKTSDTSKDTSMSSSDTKTSTDSAAASSSSDASRNLDIPSSAYGRPGQPAAAMSKPTAAGYPAASYPGAASSSFAARRQGAMDNERTLTIGSGITMSGEIESCDYLLVEGTVEAALKGASVLDIAESGVFYGTVEIEDATIAGRFEGDITAHGRLTIRSSGVVTGSISYKELEVESGAVIDGKLTPVTSASDSKSSSNKSKSSPSKSKMSKDSDSDEDAELFAGAAAE